MISLKFQLRSVIVILFAALIFLSTANAAPYFARTVSRANCLVGLRSISATLPDYGYTFNESISWDPKFWNGHYMWVTSELLNDYIGYGGIWNRKLISKVSSGTPNYYSGTWRQYAANNMKGDQRVRSRTSSNWVLGHHYERLDKSYWIQVSSTGAVDCNLNSW